MSGSTNVFSELQPQWVEDEGVEVDENFWKIIDFFVIHSLCDGQSWKGHDLHKTYLWKTKPWQPDDYLKNKLLRAIWGDIQDRELYMAKSKSEFESKIENKNLDDDFWKDFSSQRACYVSVSTGKNNSSEFKSLFYHLRNGFAHGRFRLTQISDSPQDYMIFLEDGKKTAEGFEISARIAIKMSSLLKIIDIITTGPEDDPDYSREIMECIRQGINTKRKVIQELDITETTWERETSKLKALGKIEYKKRKWQIIE